MTARRSQCSYADPVGFPLPAENADARQRAQLSEDPFHGDGFVRDAR